MQSGPPSGTWRMSIGHVLFVHPIGIPSEGPDGYTRPQNQKGRIRLYVSHLATNSTRQHSWSACSPTSLTTVRATGTRSMRPLRGVVPESELANGDPSLAVVKNGRTKGTTMGGWYRLLVSRAHCRPLRHHVWLLLGQGQLGLNRGGRIVALLTGGGGLTNVTDVTFAARTLKLWPASASWIRFVHSSSLYSHIPTISVCGTHTVR